MAEGSSPCSRQQSELATSVSNVEPLVEIDERPNDAMLVASFTEEDASGFTLFQTCVTAFKSVVGPGVLFNPHVFKTGGYIFGGVALVVAWLLWAGGVYGLMQLNLDHGCGKSYDDLAVMAFGKPGKVLVSIAIVLQQIGIVLAYFVFVASSVKGAGINVEPYIVILIMGVLEIPFCILRSVERLRPTIMLATAICAVALVWIIGVLFVGVAKEGARDGLPPIADTWSLSVGSAVFAFEGSAALALPVHNAVRPDLRVTAAKVYVGTIAGVVVMYTSMGAAGYLLYGAETQTVIINSMPEVWTTQVVRVCFAIMVFMTFPFQLFPATAILAETVLGEKDKNMALGRAFRAVFVALLALAGIALKDSLDHLTSLTGSALGIPLSFMFPAAFHWRLAQQTTVSRARHTLLLGLGGVMMVFTAGVTISTWNHSES